MFVKWTKPCCRRADTERDIPFVVSADTLKKEVLPAQRQTIGLLYAVVMMDKPKLTPRWGGGVGDD